MTNYLFFPMFSYVKKLAQVVFEDIISIAEFCNFFPKILVIYLHRYSHTHREIFYLNGCSNQHLARWKPWARNLFWVSPMSGRDPSTWTITCVPRYGSWIGRELNQLGLWEGMSELLMVCSPRKCWPQQNFIFVCPKNTADL